MSQQEQLIRVYRWLRHFGNNDSHSGNASIIDNGTVWVTPSGACADTLQADQLIAFTIDQPPPKGASLDAPLHQAVYQSNPAAHAVLHCHNPYTVALTLSGNDFVPPDFEGALYFGSVPVMEIPYESYVEQAPRQVAQALRNKPAAVVRGHGVYVWGESLDKAYKWACSLELSAKTAFIALQAGTWRP